MPFKVTFTLQAKYADDVDPPAVTVATMEEAQEKAKGLKERGFKNIIIFDADSEAPIEFY